jgi:hypothetical protein
MQVEVVPDYEDTAARRGAGHDFQEVVKSAGRALFDDAAEHAAGPSVERSEQVTDATSNVFELVSDAGVFTASIRAAAAKRLHRFFVDANHHGIRRRSQVEAANTPDLFHEVRIGTVQPVAKLNQLTARFQRDSRGSPRPVGVA